MGGRYSVIARNSDNFAWYYSLYTNNIFKFIVASVKCFIKYEIVSLGKHG